MKSKEPVEWIIEVDQDVYDQAAEVCRQYGITAEQAAEEFIRFLVIPENLPEVKRILGISNDTDIE